MGLRSHNTRAESRDHGIVRAQKKSVQRPSQDHLQTHVVWSRTLKSSVKSYVIKPSIECDFNEFQFMQVLTHDKIE